MSSLRSKASSGLKWTAIEQVVRQVLVFGIQIVLARLLLPEEFGLIAMIAMFTALGTNLMNSGLSTSLIRCEQVDEGDYSTIFFANVGISLVVYTIIFLCSPLIATFYNQPELVLITRVFALGILINAFKAVQLAKLTRQMNFKLQVKVQLPAVVIAGATAIALAYLGFGVWSLVAQALILALVSTTLFWLFSDFKPRILFDKEKFITHFNFGYKLSIAGILNAIFSNIYPLLIGRLYPAAIVGHYKQADTLSKIPVVSLSNIINRVSLPIYAKAKGSRQKLKEVNKTIVQMVLLVITPICVFAAITAPDLIEFVLTAKWLPAVPYFQILCFVAIITPISSYNTQLLKAIGRSDVFLKLAFIKKAVILICILIGYRFGVYGLIAAQGVSALINLSLNLHYTRKFTDYAFKDQVIDILRPILTGLLPALIIMFIGSNLSQDRNILIRLICMLGAGSILYVALNEMLRLEAYKELKESVKSFIA